MARAVAFPPRTQDAALALALVIINVGSVLPYGSQMHPLWLALFLVIAQAVPLAWRRSYPLAVLIAAGIPRILYDQLAFGYAPIPLATTIAFYSAMVYCRPAVRRVVIVLTVIGSIQSQIAPGHTQPYDAFVSGLTTLAAWLAAVLVRTRRAYIQEVENRVVRAESERDDEAARAAAAERTRIARELHDVVAHHVSLMAVQAEAATSLLPGRPAEAAQSVEVIAATARQALTELRRLLGVLRGPADQLETAPSVSPGSRPFPRPRWPTPTGVLMLPQGSSFTTRPQLAGTFGMVASTHWLATASGMAVLEAGGTAFDAAVATGLVLQVVEPHMNGVGGEAPIIGYDASRGNDGTGSTGVFVLDGQGPAPGAATLAAFGALDLDLIPGNGLLAACVPAAFGSLDAAAPAARPDAAARRHAVRPGTPGTATRWRPG